MSALPRPRRFECLHSFLVTHIHQAASTSYGDDVGGERRFECALAGPGHARLACFTRLADTAFGLGVDFTAECHDKLALGSELLHAMVVLVDHVEVSRGLFDRDSGGIVELPSLSPMTPVVDNVQRFRGADVLLASVAPFSASLVALHFGAER